MRSRLDKIKSVAVDIISLFGAIKQNDLFGNSWKFSQNYFTFSFFVGIIIFFYF